MACRERITLCSDNRMEQTNGIFCVVALQCLDATAGGTCKEAKSFNW
jgi:hypothetical protein